MAQRIEALRTEKGLSRPALSAALGLPKSAAEKFETGRQTPTQDQQQRLASFFGVSVFYLRGESDDRTQMENCSLTPSPTSRPSGRPARPAPERPVVTASSGGQGEGAVFSALLKSKAFQDMVHGRGGPGTALPRGAVADRRRREKGAEPPLRSRTGGLLSSGSFFCRRDTLFPISTLYSAAAGKKRDGKKGKAFLCKIPMDISRIFWQNRALRAVFRAPPPFFGVVANATARATSCAL
jgi:DNA-binding XRE family transcriptional regulator